jgi:hypothetical protein
MKYAVLLISLFINLSVYAAEEAPKEGVGEKIMHGAEKASNAMLDAYRDSSELAVESRRLHSATVLLHYSPLELLLPSKIGATFAWHRDEDTLYELEYSHSSVKASIESADLSSMEETRISLLKRNFGGGAFHWFWGVNYNSTNAHVSPLLMGTSQGNSDLIDVQTLGLTIGVGHRWVFKENFSFGVDWFSWAQPLVSLKRSASFVDETNNSEYRDDVDTALKVIGYFPRWAAFKFYLGYSF